MEGVLFSMLETRLNYCVLICPLRVLPLLQFDQHSRVSRLAVFSSKDEIDAFGKYYDFCVVNEDVERAGREAQAIVTALHCSSARRRDQVQKLLASFGEKN